MARALVKALVKVGAGVVAVGAPVGGHVALRLGQGYGVVLGLAAAQAVAAGVLLWGAGARRAGAGVSVVLLAGMGVGAWWSAQAGVLAGAGQGHALLYGALLWVFGRTLRRGRESLVTGVARRVNPTFHAGMVPYTRKVTAAWCVLFAGEIGVSAGLLAVAPQVWAGFVAGWHLVGVAALGAGELLVRKWRWRHEHATGLVAMVGGVRALRKDAAAGGRT